MSKSLFAMLLPFLNFKLSFGDGEGGAAEPPANGTPSTEEIVEPSNDEGTQPEDKPAEPKLYTEEEVRKLRDDDAARIRNKLERKLERQRIEAETRQQVMQEVKQTQEIPKDKPSSDQFQTYDAYLEALADWKAEAKFAEVQNRQREQTAKQAEQEELRTRQEKQSDLLRNGEAKYEDFEEKVTSDKHVYSQPAYLAILESDISHDLIYHLASNPEEAEAISKLSPYAQAKEIGKLEDKLSSKPPKQISKAPDPIKPVTAGKANDGKISDDLPIDEWMKRRAKESRR